VLGANFVEALFILGLSLCAVSAAVANILDFKHDAGLPVKWWLRVYDTAFLVRMRVGSRKMDIKQAKQFLVQQTAEQAALENVQLTDLERRMMYFTENDSASCENPIELNQEFEAQYDTGEYERKISRLLRHAYERLKEEDAGNLRNWKQAIRTLRKGDHYILLLWDLKPTSDLKPKSAELGPRIGIAIAWGFGLGVALVILMMLGVILDNYGLFPRRLFAWVTGAFGWISDDPFTRRLQFYFITIVLVGVWFVFRLARLGVLRDVLSGMWNSATSSIRLKKPSGEWRSR